MIYRFFRRLNLPAFQHIYVLAGNPFILPYLGKQGVSIDGSVRCKNVECSINDLGHSVSLYTFLKMPVLYPYQCERVIHWILSRTAWRSQRFKGSSGWTEWFAGPNFICCAVLWSLFAYFEVAEAFYKAIWVMVLPAPADQMLLVFSVGILQYTLIAAGFYALFSLVR